MPNLAVTGYLMASNLLNNDPRYRHLNGTAIISGICHVDNYRNPGASRPDRRELPDAKRDYRAD